MNSIKSWKFEKKIDIRVWGLETTFGPLGPRKVKLTLNHKFRILATIFTNRTSFYPDS